MRRAIRVTLKSFMVLSTVQTRRELLISWLFPRRTDHQLVSCVNSTGIVPVSSLLLRSKLSKRGSCDRAARNRTGELVIAEVQGLQVGEVRQLGRDRAGEFVAVEEQDLQVGEARQLGRDRAGELVVAEIQGF